MIPAIYYVFTSPYNHTKRFTCREHFLRCGIDTSISIVIIIINTLQSNTLSRTTAHPRNHASAQPRNTCRASGAPRIAFADFGKPPTRLLVFPARWLRAMASQLPGMGAGIPNTRKGLTLLPGLYCSAMWYVGQTHFSPITIHHRSLVRLPMRSLRTHTQRNHTLDSINWYNSRNNINPRNTLVNLNTITKRLYLILQTRLLYLRIHAQLRDSTCHHKRPPPVKAAVSYDDNVRSLGDPRPLSTIGFEYNTSFPPP